MQSADIDKEYIQYLTFENYGKQLTNKQLQEVNNILKIDNEYIEAVKNNVSDIILECECQAIDLVV